ncbi:MAG: hypothetical protein U0744_18415 [Gemmataceae bacterium]
MRRSPHLQLHYDRRRPRRPARRIGPNAAKVPRLPQAANRGIPHAPHAKRHFHQRTAGIGILTKEQALAYACSGPMLRGSLRKDLGDPEWDLRKAEPYAARTYDFKAVIPPFDVAPRKPSSAIAGTGSTFACWRCSRASRSSNRA